MTHKSYQCARILLANVCLWSSTSWAQLPAVGDTSAVFGGVVDDSGAPLRGARIALRRVGGVKLTTPFDSQFKVSGVGGLFSFTNLPVGIYQMCPNLNGSLLLDPCEWFDNPPAVALGPGPVNSGVRIRMARGKLLNIRIDDDDKKLKSKDAKDAKNFVVVGVQSPRGYHYARKTTEDANGQNHLLAVSTGVALRLSVESPGLDIKGRGDADSVNSKAGGNGNGQGNSAAPGNQTSETSTFTLKSSDDSKQFRFGAKGKP